MCLYKALFSLPKRAKADIYVIKTPSPCPIGKTFSAFDGQFGYEEGKTYRKSWRMILNGIVNSELGKEVFHACSIESSIRQAGWAKDLSTTRGVFVIPKGSLYYEGYDIGTFTIRYLGPLTEERKKLVIHQGKEPLVEA